MYLFCGVFYCAYADWKEKCSFVCLFFFGNSQLEAECNHVAAGRKQKDEIMTPLLEKMRQCYQTACAEATKLDEAIGRHFSRLGSDNRTTQVVQRSFSLCGSCNSMMALKKENSGSGNRGGNNRNAQGRNLLFCESCQQGHSLPRGDLKPKTEGEDGGPPVKCPICSFQVIQVQRGGGYEGNGYHLCPYCFSNPPIEHGGVAGGGDFRCFSCSHPSCTLATGIQGSGVDVFPCLFCSQSRQRNQSTGQVRLRKHDKGFMLSCSNYRASQCKYTIWLPRAASNVEIESSCCPNCSNNEKSVRKIKFTWKPGSVPPPYFRENIVCILCDGHFREDFQINLPQFNRVTPNQRGGRSSGGRGYGQRGGGRGRGRGGGYQR